VGECKLFNSLTIFTGFGGSMQIGDLVVQARRRNGIMGTIIRKHNEFYCNVLWVDGRREWIKTEMLEKAKPDKI